MARPGLEESHQRRVRGMPAGPPLPNRASGGAMMFQLSSNRPLLILALCTVALTAAWAVSFAVYKATPPRYSLVYDGAYYVYNNSVGNEWVHELWVDGKALEPGRDYPITITGSSALSVTARSTELDNIPDVGTASANIPIRQLAREPLTINVRVRENRGRYAGNLAEWQHRLSIHTNRDGLQRTTHLQHPWRHRMTGF